MKISIITIFPKLFDSFLAESLLAKAIKKKILKINIVDLRDFTNDKHNKVDDSPYGGGPGMVMKVDVWFKALEKVVGKKELTKRFQNINKSINQKNRKSKKQNKTKIILLDPAGEQFTQSSAQQYADDVDHLVLCCGRYEGFDHRITKLVDERISIGPYVLNGGEVAAQVITEAVFRLIPGTIGNPESLKEETHNMKHESRSMKQTTQNNNYVEYAQYTRPEQFSPTKKTTWSVPDILLSGDHKKIKEWRQRN